MPARNTCDRAGLRDAKDKLDKAVKQDPKYYKAQWVMALLMEQLDRPAEADPYYKTAMRLQPEDPDITQHLCGVPVQVRQGR